MNDQSLNDEMIALLKKKLLKDYANKTTLRDAHPKCLGLLQAKFKLDDNIPEKYQQGLFKAGAEFDCWIRCSNASGSINSDQQKDLRGLAIKLVGVAGERYSNLEKRSQDFLLLSYPTMPLGTVKLFRDAIYYSLKWHPIVFALKLLVTGKIKILKQIQEGRLHQTSPLDINYWSTTPYQLGALKVKYKLTPTSTYASQLEKTLTDDYLTTNAQKHLNQAAASFDFAIQVFHDETTTPIEDAAIEWNEQLSPFIKIATINIPQQNFATEDRFNLAEKASFSPANALLEHQPIGGLNKAREIIYQALSKFRHQQNKEQLIELDEFSK